MDDGPGQDIKLSARTFVRPLGAPKPASCLHACYPRVVFEQLQRSVEVRPGEICRRQLSACMYACVLPWLRAWECLWDSAGNRCVFRASRFVQFVLCFDFRSQRKKQVGPCADSNSSSSEIDYRNQCGF